MSSGVKNDAFANSGTALGQSNQLGANAGALYGPISSQLQTQAAHPTGLTPSQMAAQNTAAQQSAGGSMAGTVGQGALMAARTRNAGAAQNAIAQGGRQASQNLSNAALSTEQQNAGLQNQNQQNAMRGEQSLYGSELGGSQNALGLSNQALNTANSAKPSFWQQFAGQAAGDVLDNVTGAPLTKGLGKIPGF